jgi:hypothetical protein
MVRTAIVEMEREGQIERRINKKGEPAIVERER